MAGPAIFLEIITYIFQCTPPTCECDEPLKPVQDDFQHDFARMTNGADGSVFLTER